MEGGGWEGREEEGGKEKGGKNGIKKEVKKVLEERLTKGAGCTCTCMYHDKM